MKRPNFLSKTWCSLPWGPWITFRDGDFSKIPDSPGVYRVKPVGRNLLVYIGETKSLRSRLKSQLCNNALAKAMPFNDPHTAAPCLWAYRNSNGMEFECSAAERANLSDRQRKGLESYIRWRYRLEKGESSLCDLGRFHKRYKRPGNRETGKHGRHLKPGEVNSAGKASAPPLRSKGEPSDPNWMGLTWIEDKCQRGQALPTSGLYKILNSRKQLLYIGKSKGHLVSRARSHIRAKRLGETVTIWVSAPRKLRGKNPLDHHFLEYENDLIACYYERHKGAVPRHQFRGRKGRKR